MATISFKRNVAEGGDTTVEVSLLVSPHESDTIQAWGKLALKYASDYIEQFSEKLDPMSHIPDEGCSIEICSVDSNDNISGDSEFMEPLVKTFSLSESGLVEVDSEQEEVEEHHLFNAEVICFNLNTKNATNLIGGLTAPTVVVSIAVFESMNIAKNRMLRKWESMTCLD